MKKEQPQKPLVEAVKKMTALMADPHPGLSTWNEAVEEAYQEIKSAVYFEEKRRGNIPSIWTDALISGWIVKPTSCMCGGNWAWLKPRPSGAHEMYGCVCHHNPRT